MLDYSRTSRHLLVTAGDDGTVHLWDTTGRNPKVWLVYLVVNIMTCYLSIKYKKLTWRYYISCKSSING